MYYIRYVSDEFHYISWLDQDVEVSYFFDGNERSGMEFNEGLNIYNVVKGKGN